MGRAARKKRAGRKEEAQQFPLRAVPNWPLLGLALIGMGLTVYLTMIAWSGDQPAGCTVGSGCDVVLGSRWSTLLGLPTSLWGFLTYASLAGIAFMKRADIRWKIAWTISLFGLIYSLYLTAVSFIQLQATCPYCLSSATLMLIIFATVTYQFPKDLATFSWRSWLPSTLGAALLLTGMLHFYYTAVQDETGTEEPRARALAIHLSKIGAKFYGASWCPHCADQKEMFGASAHRLPYTECSPQGPRAPQAKICNDVNIQRYPTWIIDGRRYEGVLTPEELARYSGFKGGFP